jgi:hypothetical protein
VAHIFARRYGGDVREPSSATVTDAVSELYDDSEDVEHGSICLRCDLPDGGMLVLDGAVSGKVTLEEYGDQEFWHRISRRIADDVKQAEMERFFQLLRTRDLTGLRNGFRMD